MPCDYRKYPPDWATIRARILKRAGNRCEWCGVPNRALVIREPGRPEGWREVDEMSAEAAALDGERVVRIVLTVAHLENPDPMDCRDENLAAVCQRCHNRLDGRMRARHAAETRRKKMVEAGQVTMRLD